MLQQKSVEHVLATTGRGFYELTTTLQSWVRESRLSTGLLTLYLQHTSASLVIQENADPDVRSDLERFFERLVPDGDPLFEHTAEGEDDMPAHVRAVLTCVQLSVPVREARLALGTWQGIYLWEHRYQPHRRRVLLHLVGE